MQLTDQLHLLYDNGNCGLILCITDFRSCIIKAVLPKFDLLTCCYGSFVEKNGKMEDGQ